jgi:hypothetical protein
MPSAEKVQEELAKAESMYDFFGRDGIFARLFANTLEQMLEAELSDELGYEPYETSGRNLGNNRNGHYRKKVRTSDGDIEIKVPRDRNGDFEPKIVPKYDSNTNELEEKILGLYARGVSPRDIQDTLGSAIRHVQRCHPFPANANEWRALWGRKDRRGSGQRLDAWKLISPHSFSSTNGKGNIPSRCDLSNLDCVLTVGRAPTLSAQHAKHTDRSVSAGRSHF